MALSTGNQMSFISSKYFFLSANTAATTLLTGSGVFYGCYGIVAGTSWAITVYDNIAASGNLLASFTNVANTAFGPMVALGLPQGVAFNTGLTVAASGTAGSLLVIYNQFQ